MIGMYCNKCGNEIEEGSKFCNRCGAETVNEKEKVDLNKSDVVNNKEENYKFQLTKKNIRWTNSLEFANIEIKESSIIVEQYVKYLCLINGKIKVNTIKDDDIQNIVIQKTVDTVVLIYAIIFAVISVVFMQYYFLLLSALLIWVGYGYKISIIKKSGDKVLILSKICEESNEFVNVINSKYLSKES